jgi:Na+-driven multidrug efflux pump
MRVDRGRLLALWWRVTSLSWPVMVEQVSRTLMRTTDIFVTALFSPLAVAAIGLADLYARLPLRIGLGLGAGSIALSSQDTGSGAIANRDEAVTQALLIGALTGIPFIAFGVLLARRPSQSWASGPTRRRCRRSHGSAGCISPSSSRRHRRATSRSSEHGRSREPATPGRRCT